MNHSRAPVHLACIPRFAMALTLTLLFCPPGPCQTVDPVVQGTLSDWQKRYDRIGSVRYVVQGVHVIPKGSYFDDLDRPILPESPPHDIECAIKRILLLDLASKRHRLEIDDEVYLANQRKNERRISTGIFDGSVFKGAKQILSPPSEQGNNPPIPDATISSGDLRYAAFESIHWPLLFGHGIVPIHGQRVVPDQLRRESDPEMLSFHGTSVQDGRVCRVLRSRSLKGHGVIFDEISVDPARTSAVVRYVQNLNGRPFVDMAIKYKESPMGWLPASWKFSIFHSSGRLIFLEQLNVVSLQLAPTTTDADFELDLKPGMLLKETHFGGSSADQPGLLNQEEKYFRVTDSGGLDEVTFSGSQERRVAVRRWMYLSFGLLITLILLVVLRRRLTALAGRWTSST
jgi:hypothetical protein